MRRGMVFLMAVMMAAGAMAQEAPGINRLSAEAMAAQVKTLTEAAQKSATGIGCGDAGEVSDALFDAGGAGEDRPGGDPCEL